MTTARRAAAVLLFVVAAGLVWIAVLTPLRSAEIAELDAEARRLGEEWVELTEEGGNLLEPPEGASDLVSESNERFREARALEPPLDPITAAGAALIAIAAGVALWPGRSRDDDPTTDDQPSDDKPAGGTATADAAGGTDGTIER